MSSFLIIACVVLCSLISVFVAEATTQSFTGAHPALTVTIATSDTAITVDAATVSGSITFQGEEAPQTNVAIVIQNSNFDGSIIFKNTVKFGVGSSVLIRGPITATLLHLWGSQWTGGSKITIDGAVTFTERVYMWNAHFSEGSKMTWKNGAKTQKYLHLYGAAITGESQIIIDSGSVMEQGITFSNGASFSSNSNLIIQDTGFAGALSLAGVWEFNSAAAFTFLRNKYTGSMTFNPSGDNTAVVRVEDNVIGGDMKLILGSILDAKVYRNKIGSSSSSASALPPASTSRYSQCNEYLSGAFVHFAAQVSGFTENSAPSLCRTATATETGTPAAPTTPSATFTSSPSDRTSTKTPTETTTQSVSPTSTATPSAATTSPSQSPSENSRTRKTRSRSPSGGTETVSQSAVGSKTRSQSSSGDTETVSQSEVGSKTRSQSSSGDTETVSQSEVKFGASRTPNATTSRTNPSSSNTKASASETPTRSPSPSPTISGTATMDSSTASNTFLTVSRTSSETVALTDTGAGSSKSLSHSLPVTVTPDKTPSQELTIPLPSTKSKSFSESIKPCVGRPRSSYAVKSSNEHAVSAGASHWTFSVNPSLVTPREWSLTYNPGTATYPVPVAQDDLGVVLVKAANPFGLRTFTNLTKMIQVSVLNASFFEVTLEKLAGFKADEEEIVDLQLAVPFFRPKLEGGLGCSPESAVPLLRITIDADPDPVAAATQTAAAVVTATAVGSSVAVGGAAAAGDAQSLALLSMMSCTQPVEKQMTENSRLLSPLAIDKSLEGMIWGNVILVLGVLWLQVSLVFIVKRLCKMKWLLVGAKLRFPAITLITCVLTHQGTGAAALQLVFGARESNAEGTALGVIAAIYCVLLPGMLFVVTKRHVFAEYLEYDYQAILDDAAGKSPAPKTTTDGEGGDTKKREESETKEEESGEGDVSGAIVASDPGASKKPLYTSKLHKLAKFRHVLPKGRWFPPEMRTTYGPVFSSVGREHPLWCTQPTWAASLMIVGTSIKPGSQSGCVMQFAWLAVFQLLMAIITIAFRPLRSHMSNVLSAISSLCLAVVFSASATLADDPQSPRARWFSVRAVQTQLVITMLRLIYMMGCVVLEKFVMADAPQVFKWRWTGFRTSRKRIRRIRDDGESESCTDDEEGEELGAALLPTPLSVPAERSTSQELPPAIPTLPFRAPTPPPPPSPPKEEEEKPEAEELQDPENRTSVFQVPAGALHGDELEALLNAEPEPDLLPPKPRAKKKESILDVLAHLGEVEDDDTNLLLDDNTGHSYLGAGVGDKGPRTECRERWEPPAFTLLGQEGDLPPLTASAAPDVAKPITVSKVAAGATKTTPLVAGGSKIRDPFDSSDDDDILLLGGDIDDFTTTTPVGGNTKLATNLNPKGTVAATVGVPPKKMAPPTVTLDFSDDEDDLL